MQKSGIFPADKHIFRQAQQLGGCHGNGTENFGGKFKDNP